MIIVNLFKRDLQSRGHHVWSPCRISHTHQPTTRCSSGWCSLETPSLRATPGRERETTWEGVCSQARCEPSYWHYISHYISDFLFSKHNVNYFLDIMHIFLLNFGFHQSRFAWFPLSSSSVWSKSFHLQCLWRPPSLNSPLYSDCPSYGSLPRGITQE